jgi:hypothetical protein
MPSSKPSPRPTGRLRGLGAPLWGATGLSRHHFGRMPARAIGSWGAAGSARAMLHGVSDMVCALAPEITGRSDDHRRFRPRTEVASGTGEGNASPPVFAAGYPRSGSDLRSQPRCGNKSSTAASNATSPSGSAGVLRSGAVFIGAGAYQFSTLEPALAPYASDLRAFCESTGSPSGSGRNSAATAEAPSTRSMARKIVPPNPDARRGLFELARERRVL